jgi:tetratricopeptide (TPR) repeat protein
MHKSLVLFATILLCSFSSAVTWAERWGSLSPDDPSRYSPQAKSIKPTPTPTKPTPTPTKPTSTSTKPTPTPTKPATVSSPAAKAPATPARPQVSTSSPAVAALITQGKTLYKGTKFKPALAKFEEALKLDPGNDEALGLAAVTAYRLDNQSQARDFFLKRAELPRQKDSVKSYCYYRIALTHWRQVHDIVAKYCEPKENRYVADIPGRYELDVKYGVENGLEYAGKALNITKNFTEAYNVRNLLHSEAALIAPDEKKARDQNQKAEQALRKAVELFRPTGFGDTTDTADFGAPTIRIADFGSGKEGEIRLEDPIERLIKGGKPNKRVSPPFPSVRSSKPEPVDPDGGVASELSPAAAAGQVKIEILVSVTGNVVFTRALDGRSDLRGVAILAARSWKFDPAKLEGKPVQVSSVITFNSRTNAARQ